MGGKDCDSDRHYLECQVLAECCWARWWRYTDLEDEIEDEEMSWGEYFCSRLNATEFGPIGAIMWKVELQGRWRHCGQPLGSGGQWGIPYPDDLPPEWKPSELCCNRNPLTDVISYDPWCGVDPPMTTEEPD